MEKEETAIVLDFLPYGYPLEGKRIPIAQAIGTKHFTLLQLVPRRGMTLQLKEEVYIGPSKRDKVYYIYGRLPKEKLTETAKLQLQEFVTKAVAEHEQRFVDFFNNAQPINTRLHQLELLPGFGIKHTQTILEERNKKPFTSFDDIKKRIHSIPDPRKAVEKRILQELEQTERYPLFAA
jgi:putative nucleotide binding protein